MKKKFKKIMQDIVTKQTIASRESFPFSRIKVNVHRCNLYEI